MRAWLLLLIGLGLCVVSGTAEARVVHDLTDPAFMHDVGEYFNSIGVDGVTHFVVTIGTGASAVIATVDTPGGLTCQSTPFGPACYLTASDAGDVPITITFDPPVPAAGMGAGGVATSDSTFSMAFVGTDGTDTITNYPVLQPSASFSGAAELGGIRELEITDIDISGCGNGCFAIFNPLIVVLPTPQTLQADLVFSEHLDNDSVARGQPIAYTLSVTNDGPDTAKDVVLYDLLPDGVTNVSPAPAQGTDRVAQSEGDMTSGATLQATVTATAPEAIDCKEDLVNIGVAAGSTTDPNADNNFQVTHSGATPAPAEQCGRGVDADCDGLVDCTDPDCGCTLAPTDLGEGAIPGQGSAPTPRTPEAPPAPSPAPIPDPRSPPSSEPCHDLGGFDLPAYCCDPLPPPPDSTDPSPTEWGMQCRAVDPNSLEAQPAVNAVGRGFIAAGGTIAYTIHYENIGNVDAHGVGIVTFLDADLDAETLTLDAGGSFTPATRMIVWSDPVLPPQTPRTRSFSAKVRADAPPRTRVRMKATVVFPDAFPPSRTDTNFVEHVVPDPAFPIVPDLAVYKCLALGGDQWTAIVENRGFGFAYDVTATIKSAPGSVTVTQPAAHFANPRDPTPDKLAAVVPLASTASLQPVAFTGAAAGGDPCEVMTWEIRYSTSTGRSVTVDVQAAADADGDGVADYREAGDAGVGPVVGADAGLPAGAPDAAPGTAATRSGDGCSCGVGPAPSSGLDRLAFALLALLFRARRRTLLSKEVPDGHPFPSPRRDGRPRHRDRPRRR